LLAEKPFDEASVAEIARRAGASVGAFYGRFADKEALLDCFNERFFRVARASCDEFFDSAPWRAASLEDSVARFVSLLVCSHRRHCGVLRALALYVRGRPEPQFRARADAHNQYVLERVQAHLLSRPEPVAHANPARAVELAFRFTVSAVRELVLFKDVGGPTAPGDDELVGELTRAFLAYLRAGDAGKKRRPRKQGHTASDGRRPGAKRSGKP
jgi:AcrR family transcriptional regulator